MPEHTNSLRLLIVDDENTTRMMARALAERRGHQVWEAGDGAEAVAAVADSPPFDAVLMDVNMPGTDGPTALDAIRRLDDPARAGCVVIMLTTTANQSGASQLIARGADAVVHKPLRWENLAPVLSRCLADASGSQPPANPVGDAAESKADHASPIDRILADLPAERARHLLERAAVNLRAYYGELLAAGGLGDMASALMLAHKIAGVAGTYGCHGLAKAALALEMDRERLSAAELSQRIDALSADFDQEVELLERRAAAI